MKTKILINAFLCVLFFNGCANHISEDPDEPDEKRYKTIVFETDLLISHAPVKAISEDITKLIVLDYQGGAEKQKIEQHSSEDNFGKITLSLEYGNHELLFVGHNSLSSTFSYPSVTFDKTTDVFSYYLSLDVKESSLPTKNIAMDRSVGLVKIVAKDAIPENVSSLKVTLDKYYPILNVKTSASEGEPQIEERIFEYKTSHIGVAGTTYSIYTFTPDNGFVTNISISAIDAKGDVIHTIIAPNVSVERNRQTILTGNIFQSDLSLDVSVNSQWDDDIHVPI